MEPRDNEPNIRPIPIEADDGTLLPDAGGPRRRHSVRPNRPWMPLAVSGMAIAVLVGAVGFFGAVDFDDPPAASPETFSLTTVPEEGAVRAEVLPPTLAEMIPGVTERLTLVTADDDAVRTFVWDPSFRVPNEFEMMTSVDPDAKEPGWHLASFDAGGRYVAVARVDATTDQGIDIWIGPPTEIGATPSLENVYSYVWHATDVSRLGYVTSAENGYVLETVDVDILSKTPSNPTVVLALDERPSLLRWDNDGLVVQIEDEIAVLDAQGAELWRLDGWAQSASPGHIAQIRRTGTGYEWYLINRESAETHSFAEFGVDADADATNVVASHNSDIFAVVTNRESRSSITIVGPAQNAPRIVQVDDLVYPYKFTSDSQFLILRSPTSNDLTFVDWRTGATHILDVAAGTQVLAINIG